MEKDVEIEEIAFLEKQVVEHIERNDSEVSSEVGEIMDYEMDEDSYFHDN